MDSISDVIKELRHSPMMQQLEQKRRKLLDDPLVKQFRAEHPELSEEDVTLHLNRIRQYVCEAHACEDCTGLTNCPNGSERSLHTFTSRAHRRAYACT